MGSMYAITLSGDSCREVPCTCAKRGKVGKAIHETFGMHMPVSFAILLASTTLGQTGEPTQRGRL